MRTHEERVLVAGLGSLNVDLGRYVLKVLEADHTGTHWPHTAEDEAVIALQMMNLARQLEVHAKQLQDTAGKSEPIVIDVDSAPRQLAPRAEQ